jgi:hypothetical protein
MNELMIRIIFIPTTDSWCPVHLGLVSCQSCNVVKNVVSNLHNQPGRIGYEEIHCDAHRRGA